MKKKYWFWAKNYGWGWYPASIEGWIVIFVFIILETSLAFSRQPILTFFGSLVLIAILLFICIKTGEKPSWKWGKKNGR